MQPQPIQWTPTLAARTRRDHRSTVRDAELDDTLRLLQLLWQLNHALEVRSKRMAATIGVTGPQRFVLRLVGEFPHITAGELARLVRVHPSTLSGVLRRLVHGAFVACGRDPADGRRTLYALTAKGRRLHDERRGTVEEVVAEALANIPEEEIAIARRALAEVAAKLEVLDARPAPAKVPPSDPPPKRKPKPRKAGR